MISIRNLEKNYSDFRLNISLEIPKGRITGLVGKNGSGKTTTIKAILGLIRPDGGSVMVLGHEASDLPAELKNQLGIALSESGFSPYFTITDVVAMSKKFYTDFDADWFLAQCKEQGIPLKKIMKEFSTGMKAKVRVLLALSHKAKLLVMDEPTSGLDVEARNEILEIIRDYMAADEERSMLITSHISSDLEGLCDDIYMIHKGRVILHEDTDRILANYAILKVSPEDYARLDKSYLLKTKEESFGMRCLTDEKQFYAENYPSIVIENSGIDEMILMLTAR